MFVSETFYRTELNTENVSTLSLIFSSKSIFITINRNCYLISYQQYILVFNTCSAAAVKCMPMPRLHGVVNSDI